MAAIAAAATGIVALTKASIENYAEYEQLVGGVETLFKDSSDTVVEYANNAYKTAGLSANDYMATVTSFSASLLQSLGGDTAAAADMADMAITDMSDNANKMGTDMEAIQYAYNGFAKQNYVMLDNLKLGYGGTKEEMERLIADAEKLTGLDLDISSYADIVTAIHAVQTEMGITGTTAEEASSTIQGSVSSMSSAWQNFLTGMADPSQDFDSLLGNLIDSVLTVADNLVPRLMELLPRLAEGLTQLIQNLMPYIPPMIQQLLPSVIEGAMALLNGVVQSLPVIVNAIAEAVPMIIDGIVEMLPLIVEAGVMLIISLVQGIGESLPELIPAMVEAVILIVETLIDNVGLMIDASVALIVGLAGGLIAATPILIEKAPEIIAKLVVAIIEAVPKLLDAAVSIVTTLAQGIVENFGKLQEKGKELVDQVKDGFMEKVEAAKNWGRDLIQNFVDGLMEKWNTLKQTVSDVAQSVADFLGFSEPKEGPLSNFHTYAPDMMKLFAQGIKDNENLITEQLNSSLSLGSITGAGNSTNLGGITVNVVGAVTSKKEAKSIAETLAISTRQQLRYKGVLA